MTDEERIFEGDATWADFLAEMEAPSGLDDDESRIDYLLENIQAREAELARNHEIARQRVSVIQDWEQGEGAKIERRLSWLRSQIGMLAPPDAEKMKAAHGKFSRDLPHGTFGFRVQKGDGERVEITDPEKALAYAEKHELNVAVVPEARTVTRTVLKEHAKATGAKEGEGWEYYDSKKTPFVKAAK